MTLSFASWHGMLIVRPYYIPMLTLSIPPHFQPTDRIAMAISGGVDSAVSLYLLKQKRYQVDAIFMRNWQTEDTHCSADQDLMDARKICKLLQVKLIEVNFEVRYFEDVFQPSLKAFSDGLTPNPDVMCNKIIKFHCLYNLIKEKGYQWLATGHYVKILYPTQSPSHTQLHQAHDLTKDQSYFLCQVRPENLYHSWFPLGDHLKTDVRQLAKSVNLPVSEKKDSTGLCFIGERPFKDFLKNYLLTKPGKIVDLKGQRLGQHEGLMYYTIGQRKGLKIGGQKNQNNAPWYVVKKSLKTNELIVCQGKNHPALYHTHIQTKSFHWIGESIDIKSRKLTAKVRYRQESIPCQIELLNDNTLYVTFTSPVWAITEGQYFVPYKAKRCLGGAMITQIIQ